MVQKDDVINNLLNRKTMNHGMAIKPRKYSDILVGQFEIGKVIRVNRKNDENTISDKIFDFSNKTIKHLRESGYSNSMDLVTWNLVRNSKNIISEYTRQV